MRWGLGLALLFGVRVSFADHYRVPTGSMEPTVQPGDHVCVEKSAYGLRVPFADRVGGHDGGYVARWSHPSRGEVVVLRSPETGETLLKRVVAIGGDEVAVEDGRVRIDGRAVPTHTADDAGVALVEDLGRPHPLGVDRGGGPDLAPTHVPAGKVLVLGDARGNSHDGRSFGFVDESEILGRARSVCLRGSAPTWQPL